jgi:hypothetical protein
MGLAVRVGAIGSAMLDYFLDPTGVHQSFPCAQPNAQTPKFKGRVAGRARRPRRARSFNMQKQVKFTVLAERWTRLRELAIFGASKTTVPVRVDNHFVLPCAQELGKTDFRELA